MTFPRSDFSCNQMLLVGASLFTWSLDFSVIYLAWNLRSGLRPELMAWFIRLLFLLIFVWMGYELFQPRLNRHHPVRWRRFYTIFFGAFLIGIIVYFLIITIKYEGVVALGDPEIKPRPTRLGFDLYYHRYYFSWRNYFLYPVLNLTGLLLKPILEQIRNFVNN